MLSVEALIGIGGLAVTILGGGVTWLLKIQGQLSSKLSREEHERICTERNDRVERKLEAIEAGVTGTHRRIDDLYRDLMARDGGR